MIQKVAMPLAVIGRCPTRVVIRQRQHSLVDKVGSGVQTRFGVESFPLEANQIEAGHEPQMPETTYEDVVMIMTMTLRLYV